MSANSERETATGKVKLAKSRSVAGGSPNGAGPIRGGVVEEVQEEDEKENVDFTEKITSMTRRRNLVPALS
jgi:hypothetical protein